MGRYASGYRLERRVQQLYSEMGWLATRFPSSGRQLYPADVLAIKRCNGGTQIHLVECKNSAKNHIQKSSIYLEVEQITKLISAAEQHHALALVAYSFPRQHARITPAHNLKSTGKMLHIDRNDGVSLKSFLADFE